MSDFSDAINLYNYMGYNNHTRTITDLELRELFTYMDKALKYLHTHGYKVDSFSPEDIEILNNSKKYIKFNKFSKCDDSDIEFKNNLFDLCVLEIGSYSNTLDEMRSPSSRNFLKSNFDSFIVTLPNDDINYYRGVIERGAAVYYNDFLNEKNKRELQKIEAELSGSGEATNIDDIKYDDTNDNINKYIYRLEKENTYGFLSLLLYPFIIVLCILLIISVIEVIKILN